MTKGSFRETALPHKAKALDPPCPLNIHMVQVLALVCLNSYGNL